MQESSRTTSRGRWPYVLVVAAGLLAVFVLPWYVPVPGPPSLSDSYMAGFNNRVAQLAVIAMAGGLALMAWRRRSRSSTPRQGVWLAGAVADARVDTRAANAVYALAAASAFVFSWLAIPTYFYGEKGYFLDRMAYVAAGYSPYRDFEFPYGPLFLYLASWSRSLFRLLGLSASASYLIVYIPLFLVGFVVLRFVVERVRLPRAWRTLLFVAIAAQAVINETMGLNYTLLRFATPVASVLLVHARFSVGIGTGRPPRWLRMVTLAFAVVALNLAISPELGIAVFLALAVYLVVVARDERRESLAALAAYAAAPLALLMLLPRDWLTSLLTFAGGGLDLLVLPGPPMLVYLAGVALVAAWIPRLLDAPRPDAAATLAIATLAIVLVPVALGRADAGHVMWNSVPLVLLAAAATARISRAAFRAYLTTFAAVYLLAHALHFGALYGGTLPRPEPAVLSPLTADQRRALDAYPALAAPYGFVDETGFYLADTGALLSSYYARLPVDDAGVEVWRSYMDRAPFAIVPADLFPDIPDPTNETLWQQRSVGELNWQLTMFPMTLRARNELPNVPLLMDRYLRANYERAGAVRDYLILKRTTPLSAAVGR
jgi:hypothetical protein